MWLLLKEPFLFNESTITEFGWTDPVGMKVRRMGDSNDPATGEYTIIGVVKDFHYESLHRDIDSFMFFSYPSEQQVYTNLNIKIRPENAGEILAAIEEKWKQYMPGQPFSYFFLDDRLNELYNNEKISGQIFNVFSILTIFIACVGLFGLSPKSRSVSRPSRRPMLILPMPSGRSESISV